MLFIHCPPSMKMQRSLSPFFARKAWPALRLQPKTCHSLFTSFCWIRLYFILVSSPLLQPSSASRPPPRLSLAPLSIQKGRSSPVWELLNNPWHTLPALFALRAFKKWEPEAHNSLEMQPQNCLISLLAQASASLGVEIGFTAANSDTQIGDRLHKSQIDLVAQQLTAQCSVPTLDPSVRLRSDRAKSLPLLDSPDCVSSLQGQPWSSWP